MRNSINTFSLKENSRKHLHYCTYSFIVKPVSTALPTLLQTGFKVHLYAALRGKMETLQSFR